MEKHEMEFNQWKKNFEKPIEKILEEIMDKGIGEAFEVFKEQVLQTCFAAYRYDQDDSLLEAEKRSRERLKRIAEEIPAQLEHLDALIEFSEKLGPLMLLNVDPERPENYSNKFKGYKACLKSICSSFKNRKSWAFAGLIYPGTMKKGNDTITRDPVYLSLVYHMVFLFRNFTAEQHYQLPEPSPLAKEYGIDPFYGEDKTRIKYWIDVDFQKMPEYGKPLYKHTLQIVECVLSDRKRKTVKSVQKLIEPHEKNGVLLTHWE